MSKMNERNKWMLRYGNDSNRTSKKKREKQRAYVRETEKERWAISSDENYTNDDQFDRARHIIYNRQDLDSFWPDFTGTREIEAKQWYRFEICECIEKWEWEREKERENERNENFFLIKSDRFVHIDVKEKNTWKLLIPWYLCLHSRFVELFWCRYAVSWYLNEMNWKTTTTLTGKVQETSGNHLAFDWWEKLLKEWGEWELTILEENKESPDECDWRWDSMAEPRFHCWWWWKWEKFHHLQSNHSNNFHHNWFFPQNPALNIVMASLLPRSSHHDNAHRFDRTEKTADEWCKDIGSLTFRQ